MNPCPDCGEASADRFHLDATKASGHCTYCKTCASARRLVRRERNPNREKRNSANYALRKNQSRPLWLNPAQIDELERFQERAERETIRTKIVHVVDHIVPLCGIEDGKQVVCGLDVPWNLAILSHSENAAKGGKLNV